MKRMLALALALSLTAVACGSDDAADVPVSTTTTVAADPMGEMDGVQMYMGDAAATPASEVPGAEVVTGRFDLLDTRPQGYDAVTGTAALARHDDGTTVTIQLSGLKPGVVFISHVHEGTCAEYGGDHYRFDPDGSDLPPNEIHLAFRSTEGGNGFMTAENDGVVDERAVSVVLHPRDLLDNKIACAQFGS